MGFSSIDDLVNEITNNGKIQRVPFVRTIFTSYASVAGRWHECLMGVGTGGVGLLASGSAGVGAALNGASAGALPQGALSVSPDTKHLLGFSVVTSATTAVPAWVMLTDILYQYPLCVVTGTPTPLDNTEPKPSRFNNGIGVQCSAIVVSNLGAAQPALTLTYTNQSGVGSKTGQVLASANYLPAGSFLGAGVAANLTGPILPLMSGDTGVSQLDGYAIASGTSGQVTFVLHRPIAMLPLVAANVAGERDFLSQMPALPKIEDDACLGMFILIGGALTSGNVISGELLMGWG